MKIRKDLIHLLEEGNIRVDEYYWKHLYAPPLYTYLPMYAITYLDKLATSVKYSSKIEYKYSEIDRVMEYNGFIRMGRGTNRAVYRHLEDKHIVSKVAVDDVGIRDNPREMINQEYIYPFVTKMFEVSPIGTVALVERDDPFTHRAEFASVANKIYDLIRFWFTGKYVMEDIGTNYFMNWGIRLFDGCPVLHDYPYMYELDYRKIYCQKPDIGGFCGGEIDYDDGYNKLICPKCGAVYRASDLAKEIEKGHLRIDTKEAQDMRFKVRLQMSDGTERVIVSDTNDRTGETSIIEKRYEAASKVSSNMIKRIDNQKIDTIEVDVKEELKKEEVRKVKVNKIPNGSANSINRTTPDSGYVAGSTARFKRLLSEEPKKEEPEKKIIVNNEGNKAVEESSTLKPAITKALDEAEKVIEHHGAIDNIDENGEHHLEIVDPVVEESQVEDEDTETVYESEIPDTPTQFAAAIAATVLPPEEEQDEKPMDVTIKDPDQVYPIYTEALEAAPEKEEEVEETVEEDADNERGGDGASEDADNSGESDVEDSAAVSSDDEDAGEDNGVSAESTDQAESDTTDEHQITIQGSFVPPLEDGETIVDGRIVKEETTEESTQEKEEENNMEKIFDEDEETIDDTPEEIEEDEQDYPEDEAEDDDENFYPLVRFYGEEDAMYLSPEAGPTLDKKALENIGYRGYDLQGTDENPTKPAKICRLPVTKNYAGLIVTNYEFEFVDEKPDYEDLYDDIFEITDHMVKFDEYFETFPSQISTK